LHRCTFLGQNSAKPRKFYAGALRMPKIFAPLVACLGLTLWQAACTPFPVQNTQLDRDDKTASYAPLRPVAPILASALPDSLGADSIATVENRAEALRQRAQTLQTQD
jgi:hypothetical protein